ncbi:MAG: hypothetical protein EP298_03090 [Gammaproteobacteria bacterium]|nr:MAG: hypothetical protein EP298_03090 [Gammaproteobacteria bacterium]UTW43588.1 hypothetical protein KFE69_05725 [bacterium SCSIO 12844]
MRYLAYCLMFFSLFISFPTSIYALYTPSNDSNYDSNNNTDQNNSSTTNNQNSGLQTQMDKKTKEALKTFKNFKFEDQAKQDFFDTVGKDPSSSEFESGSFDSGTYSDQSSFKIKDSSDSDVLGR